MGLQMMGKKFPKTVCEQTLQQRRVLYKRLLALFVIFFVSIRLLADYIIRAVPNASHNTGTAFSFPAYGAIQFLLISGGLVCISLLFFSKNRIYITPVALLLAGACNNIFERIRYGAVIDPITIYNWQGNTADIFIALAVILLIWGMIQGKNI